MPSGKQIKEFQRKVLDFYARKGRSLPWRETTDPYSILVSEVMLQQTQVDRVKNYFKRWIEKWPTVYDLAKANKIEVLSMWQGLGYNRRALYLHKGAKIIVEKFSGDVLEAAKSYKKVPGIGPYTSKAVQIFAANKNEVTVDTNIRRILINEFNLDQTVTDKELRDLANICLPKGKSRDWHNGLMDYGSLVLTSRRTGIKPKTQQKSFKGSDREIRGRLLRGMLKEVRAYTIQELCVLGRCKNEERVVTIAKGMVREGLVQYNGETYHL